MIRTLDALPALRYEIGLLRRDAEPEKQMRRFEWTRDRVVQSIPWLKRENALGREILFRPSETRYVLVDDVKPAGVQALRAAGHEPAAVVETSQDNLQVWVKLPHIVAADERTEIGRELAAEAGGDKGSVAWDKLGKLPGFTNRKPKHEFDRDGHRLAPFVLLLEAAGAVASLGVELIARIRAKLKPKSKHIEEPKQPRRTRTISPPVSGLQENVRQYYVAIIARELPKTGGDRSAADFRAARDLLEAGYSRYDVAAALATSSHVAGRDAAGVTDYTSRTIDAASAPRAQRDTTSPIVPPRDLDQDLDQDLGPSR